LTALPHESKSSVAIPSPLDKSLSLSVKGIQNARSQVRAASGSAINSTNSMAIANSRTTSQSSNVTVGKVEIKTKATDSEGIARSVGGHLNSQLKRATSNHDDGIKA